jgi:ATP-binding protein involved in chromosome partitioning
MDPVVRVGGDTGKPVVITQPDSEAAVALTNIAEQIAARVSVAALTGTNAPTINIV